MDRYHGRNSKNAEQGECRETGKKSGTGTERIWGLFDKEFEEKLMRAAASKAELEGLASKIKGSENAVIRDQLVTLVTMV